MRVSVVSFVSLSLLVSAGNAAAQTLALLRVRALDDGASLPASARLHWIAFTLAMIAIGVCAMAVAVAWMWRARDAVSIELLFWEARGRLIRDAVPPGMTLTFPSLVLDAVFVTGSARGAAIALGAVSLAGLFLLIGPRRSSWWMLPLLLHPVMLLGAAASPVAVITTLLITATTVDG